MANQYWRGDAVAVAQVNTVTVGGTPALGQVYSVIINGKSVSYTASGVDTNTTIAAALQALLIASTAPPEFSEVTWTVATNVITGTSAAGKPFTNTSSATGTGTLTTAIVTNPTGPTFWSEPTNWVSGSVPVTGDSVYLRNFSGNITDGLAQSGVTLALLDIDSTFTGQIGRPDTNTLVIGGTSYAEYRPTFLAIGATLLNIGRGSGSCSNMIRINCGSVQTTATVYNTANPTSQGGIAFDFLGTHASNVLNVYNGNYGVAAKPGSTSTVLSSQIGSGKNVSSTVQGVYGDGCTLGTVLQYSGQIQIRNGLTTLTMEGGTATLLGTAGVTTLTNNAGTVNYGTSGTCTTYTGGYGATLDASKYAVSRTFTNTTLNAKTSFIDPGKTITFTNPFIVSCSIEQLGTLEIGESIHIQRS